MTLTPQQIAGGWKPVPDDLDTIPATAWIEPMFRGPRCAWGGVMAFKILTLAIAALSIAFIIALTRSEALYRRIPAWAGVSIIVLLTVAGGLALGAAYP